MMAQENEQWTFDDRVLVWLEPSWANQVQTFYASPDKEERLQGMLSETQLEKLDRQCESLLRVKLGITTRKRRKPIAIWFKGQ